MKIYKRYGDVIVRRSTHGSGASAVNASFHAGLSSHGRAITRNVLESRCGPALLLRERQPELKYAALTEWHHVLVVDHAAPGRHPQYVSCPERSFIAVAQLSFHD